MVCPCTTEKILKEYPLVWLMAMFKVYNGKLNTCSAPTVLIGLHLYKLLINLGIKELKKKQNKRKLNVKACFLSLMEKSVPSEKILNNINVVM